jgi:hypothetical protein
LTVTRFLEPQLELSAMEKDSLFEVVYDFYEDEEGEMTVLKGDIVKIIGWFCVFNVKC